MSERSLHPARNRRTFRAASTLAGAMLLAAATRASEPEPAAVDATCAWGRLSDGRGRLVRCLTRDEARSLREAVPAPAAPASEPIKAPAVSAPSPDAVKVVASAPEARGAALAVPVVPVLPAKPAPSVAPLTVPPAKPALSAAPLAVARAEEPVPAPEAAQEGSLAAEIGAVVADVGALPETAKNLRKALDKLAECAEKNGGLSAERGEVELRFLVQARGRAEGVSLKKRRGVSEAAARCIAGVVDRRFVGYPEEPAVGATLVVAVTKKKK